jgi:hypothetical protein
MATLVVRAVGVIRIVVVHPVVVVPILGVAIGLSIV